MKENNLKGVIGATVDNYDRINNDKSEEKNFNVFFDMKNTNAYDIVKICTLFILILIRIILIIFSSI